MRKLLRFQKVSEVSLILALTYACWFLLASASFFCYLFAFSSLVWHILTLFPIRQTASEAREDSQGHAVCSSHRHGNLLLQRPQDSGGPYRNEPPRVFSPILYLSLLSASPLRVKALYLRCCWDGLLELRFRQRSSVRTWKRCWGGTEGCMRRAMPALRGQATWGPWCTVIQKTSSRGTPWWPSGSDTKLSLLRAGVRSLVRELRRSHKPQGTAKKRKDLLPRIHRRSGLVSGSRPFHLRQVRLLFFGLVPLLKPICTLIRLLFIKLCFKSDFQGDSLAVQWLGLCFRYWGPGFNSWLGN